MKMQESSGFNVPKNAAWLGYRLKRRVRGVGPSAIIHELPAGSNVEAIERDDATMLVRWKHNIELRVPVSALLPLTSFAEEFIR